MSIDLWQFGFMPSYKVSVHYRESQHQHVEVKEHDTMGDDKMGDILDAIWLEFEVECEVWPTPMFKSSLTSN